jgi:branched-chain amino acid aminotransferase
LTSGKKVQETKIMSMADRDGFIWMDGKLVPWREATTHVLTHSLHYGLSVFEGVRAYKTVNGTAIFRLKEHTERLFNSAHIYMMKIPYSKEHLMEAQLEVVRANKLESCYLRPIAFYGSEKMGVSPRGAAVHVSIAAWPWGAYLGEEGLEKGIRVKTASFARHHVNVTMPRAKVATTYANSILANLEATQDGYDEALLLDTHGFVAEGAGENVFIIKNGKHLRTADYLRLCAASPAKRDPSRWLLIGLRSHLQARSPATTSISPTKPSSPAPPLK